jgi:hypothetical protein
MRVWCVLCKCTLFCVRARRVRVCEVRHVVRHAAYACACVRVCVCVCGPASIQKYVKLVSWPIMCLIWILEATSSYTVVVTIEISSITTQLLQVNASIFL